MFPEVQEGMESLECILHLSNIVVIVRKKLKNELDYLGALDVK